jgi:hypothetical protein
MNTKPMFRLPVPVLGAALLLIAGAAQSAVRMEGLVTLDYYIAEVDAEGFEYADADFYVERMVNDSTGSSGPLSLVAWLTAQGSPSGSGIDVADLSVGTLPGNSVWEIWGTAFADDAAPGEYYVHTLLQDDRIPGTYEDARSLSPRLLWRGGLEAVGPLDVYVSGSWLSVSFGELANHRLDGRLTNDILLTLYATYGFGPASDGYELCRVRVPGLYAGERRFDPSFDCRANAVPNGEYTLHLGVSEVGGRGGDSTLSGPDAKFRGGYLLSFHGGTGYIVYSGAWGPAGFLLLLLPLLLRRR